MSSVPAERDLESPHGAARPTRAHALRTNETGEGPPVLLLHGFGLRPQTYLSVADRLADRCRVLIPHILSLPERWSIDTAIACVEATLDERGIGEVTLLCHSFGGGIGLGFTAKNPDRVVEAVFADTLGLSREWVLAREALRPATLLRLASPRAAADFLVSCMRHPLQLSRAGWWGFVGDRRAEIETIAAAGVRCHVLWAGRDTLLARKDGLAFARELGATFTVARSSPLAKPLDHDWMFRRPDTFVSHLERLGLRALRPDTA
jgi:pimeloyl-ACP methyl ester carboxylesterase